MKLVIGGSTGFVGSELVRQALVHPSITSIIALSRRETPLPPDSSKLKEIVCDDFENYTSHVKKELESADACIWAIAVTPVKLKTTSLEDAAKISRDYATTAIQTLASLKRNPGKPLRFVYVSGHVAPRNPAEVPKELADAGLINYGLMRGDAELRILEYARQSGGAVEACVVKPGVIDSPDREKRIVPGIPNIERHDFVSVLLDQTTNGFEKDTLRNDDMIRIYRKILAKYRDL
ncbi:hypothetical protein F4806DRAFT_501483 [Annulohypoxylon nitens]|nr:hypothetical protein F4806DRAFT_501483 [Annulohypoxylon nitens]